MIVFHKEYAEGYGIKDFEKAAQRLLGDRYLELKALSASPEQICSEFSQYFFNGILTETKDNRDDITLLLTIAADIFVGLGHPNFNDVVPAGGKVEVLPLAELLVRDIAPDRRGYTYNKLKPLQPSEKPQKTVTRVVKIAKTKLKF